MNFKTPWLGIVAAGGPMGRFQYAVNGLWQMGVCQHCLYPIAF
jgi:hypothetical protein